MSPIGFINGYANGVSQIQSFSTVNDQIVPTGRNWSDVARYQNGMVNVYYLTPTGANAANSQQGYNTAPAGYGSSTGTFTATNQTYSSNYTEDGLRRFIDSVRKASYSAVTGLSDTYRNLSGNNTPTNLPSVPELNSAYNNPVFDATIGSQNNAQNIAQGLEPQYQKEKGIQAQQDMSDVQIAREIAQEVRTNLQELRATVDMIRRSSATSTHAQAAATSTNTHPKEIQPEIHGNATSTNARAIAASSTEPAQTEKATAAIDAAEKRVERIQTELDAGTQKLSESNARVRELTAELNALNDRIKAGNKELSDPTLSKSDQTGLLSALIENIQLALSDAEKRLEHATADSPPPTVGHVVISGFGNAVSGAVDLSVKISLTFTQLIQNFWHTLFPAY